MRKIYTYGGRPAMRNLTVADLRAGKGKRKFTQVTAVTAEEAQAVETVGIDTIGCWDRDVRALREGAPTRFLTAGLAYTDYVTNDEILRAAITAIEGGADAVYTPRGLGVVEMLAREDIAVQGHLGLVPRKSTLVGGIRPIGKTADEALELYRAFRSLEDAGAFAVEVELVPEQTLAEINMRTGLVTYSIGSGSAGDVIFLFMEDICGDLESPPRHAKAFGNLLALRKAIVHERLAALKAFKEHVGSGAYPTAAHSVQMPSQELDKFREALARMPSSCGLPRVSGPGVC